MNRILFKNFCSVSPLAQRGNFSFEVIKKEKDSLRFIDMICDHFSRREMSMTGVGCSKADLHTVFDHMGEYLLKNHTAIMVKDNSTKEIVSGLLGMDYCYQYPKEDEDRLSSKGRNLFQVLGWYKKKNQENGHVEKKDNTYFYVFAGFTVESYESKGLYTQLNSLVEDLARKKGFQYMIRETGAPEMVTILKRAGYQEILKQDIEKVDYGFGIKVNVPIERVSIGESGIPYWIEFKKKL